MTWKTTHKITETELRLCEKHPKVGVRPYNPLTGRILCERCMYAEGYAVGVSPFRDISRVKPNPFNQEHVVHLGR